MYIEKIGQNKFGTWVLFEYFNGDLIIKGIASTKLEDLKEDTTYDNLALLMINKNKNIYYNIVEKMPKM